MIRSTRSITLVLVSCGLAALGFGLWNRGTHPYATTRPYQTGYHGGWWARSFGGGSSGSNSAVRSNTSRGGFGSSGWHVSS